MSSSNEPDLLVAFTTVSTEAQAAVLADAAIERRLAACVHSEAIRSTYRWHGKVEHENEIRLIFKTTRSNYQALQELLIQLHPYELPAVFALPVTAASREYLNWVAAETRGQGENGGA